MMTETRTFPPGSSSSVNSPTSDAEGKAVLGLLNHVILDQIQMERDGDVIDKHLIKSCVYMLESLYDDEMETEENRDSVAEDRWKPLPPEASKPGGERQFVNVHRRMVGKKPFSKDEWPPAPVKKQKRSTGGKKAKV